MKKLHYLFSLLACLIAGATLIGCSSNDEPADTNPSTTTCSGEVTDTRPGNVTITLTTANLKTYAYLLYEKEEAPASPTLQVINATGISGELTDGKNTIRLGQAIQPSTDYVVYFALTTTSDQFYGQPLKFEFTTSGIDEVVSLISSEPDGIIINVNIPESVTKAGNVLRWQVCDWFTHVSRLGLDVDNLLFNGQKMISESQAMDLRNSNAYNWDDLDENGDPYERWNPMAPGEPVIFWLGEFKWTDTPNWGWSPGYHEALFDWERFINDFPNDDGLTPPLGTVSLDYTSEDPYWTGYHSRHIFYTAQPETMTKTVKWESIDPRPNRYAIRFTPDEGIKRFCFFILTEEEYNIFTQYIGGEKHWQWFVTSVAAMYEGSNTVRPAEGVDYVGVTEVTSEEILISGVEPSPKETYHIVLTAMGDEKGMQQSFLHDTFRLPDYTMPAPEVTVTPLEEKTTDSKVCFNIKSTNPKSPVAWARYICGYQANFAASGSDYASLAQGSNGAQLSADDIAKINSEEGLDVEFSSRPNAVTRLAVYVKNEEGMANDINKAGSPAVADIRSKRQADAPRVESELFEKLVGDWTATANVSVFGAQAGTFVPATEPRQVKVTIQGGIEYTDKAPAIIQQNNPLWDPNEIAMYWEQYKEEADIYNAGVRGQNRLLCMGFGFEQTEPFVSRLPLQTPLDLFARPDYSSSVLNLFVRFGPKWYLQIAEGNKVTVPVNIDTIGSLTSWSDGTDYYMMGWNFSDGRSSYVYYDPSVPADADNTLHFPVTVSADYNTITINPFEFDGKKYYPSTTYFSKATAGAAETTNTIVTSPIVMTRGWNGDGATSSKYPAIRSTRSKTDNGPVRLDRTPIEKVQPIRHLEPSPYREAAYERMQKRLGR